MNCPQCQAEAARVGSFWICPVHGQISPRSSRGDEAQTSPAAPAPLRIFLSYGHDSNEDLVRRIKADLEKRGHDGWFDKNEIKFGDEWRRAIPDGILNSNRVLSFLSKHSSRCQRRGRPVGHRLFHRDFETQNRPTLRMERATARPARHPLA